MRKNQREHTFCALTLELGHCSRIRHVSEGPEPDDALKIVMRGPDKEDKLSA
jgi:hypothetical protein